MKLSVAKSSISLSLGEHTANMLGNPAWVFRTCTASYSDLKGVEHVIEVTADSLYEAVAQGLRVFRENDWIDEVGRGQTTISVVVRQPEVQHKVRVQEFERWSRIARADAC